MNSFVQRHAGSVIGMLSGWDRLRFRGTLRMLANVTGLASFLNYTGHLLKDFGDHAFQLSRQVRNRDLQRLLFASAAAGVNESAQDEDEDEKRQRRRRSGQMTRKLRMLRAHGLIRKVPHTHRYLVSRKGRQVIAALRAAREADVNKLAQAA